MAMDNSHDLDDLIQTFKSLPCTEQQRMLTIADLLLLASGSVQSHTRAMLDSLIVKSPRSQFERLAAVDEIIDYLERAMGLTHRGTARSRQYLTVS